MRSLDRAVAAVETHGALLVFPHDNKPEPRSMWHVLHPRSEMRWAWDDGADPRVAALWHLRSALSSDPRVVYTKWLQGRATLLSLPVFRAMLGALRSKGDLRARLSRDALAVLDALDDDSPQATRALRETVGLPGRAHEAAFNRAMRPLWERLLVVGAGEVDEGGFPSLAVASTRVYREDEWLESESPSEEDAAALEKALSERPVFARSWRRVLAKVSAEVAGTRPR